MFFKSCQLFYQRWRDTGDRDGMGRGKGGGGTEWAVIAAGGPTQWGWGVPGGLSDKSGP